MRVLPAEDRLWRFAEKMIKPQDCLSNCLWKNKSDLRGEDSDAIFVKNALLLKGLLYYKNAKMY